MTSIDWSSSELHQHGRALWFGVLTGPLGWIWHLLIMYGMAALACSTGWPGFTLFGLNGAHAIMTIFTVLVELLILAAGATAFSALRMPHAGNHFRGARFDVWMANAGVLLSGMFFIAVFFAALPAITLTACR